MRRCKSIGDIALMEVGRSEVRTKATEATSTGASKRRKIVSPELQYYSSSTNNVNCLSSPATSATADHVSASRCSSNDDDSSSVIKDSLFRSVDLESKGFENENSTFMDGIFSRETSPLSEICADSEELEESPAKPSNRQRSSAGKMPTEAEIDQFFSAAEKYEQKRFEDKYNYDVVKDVALEGRYQWVLLAKGDKLK